MMFVDVPALVVEVDGGQTSLEADPTAHLFRQLTAVVHSPRHSSDVQVVGQKVVVNRPSVRQIVHCRRLVHSDDVLTDRWPENGHIMPVVVVEGPKTARLDHSRSTTDVEDVAKVSARELDRHEVLSESIATVENQSIQLSRLQLQKHDSK